MSIAGHTSSILAATTLGGSYSAVTGQMDASYEVTSDILDTTAFDDGQWRTKLKGLMGAKLSVSGRLDATGTGIGYIKAAAVSASGSVFLEYLPDGTNGIKAEFLISNFKQSSKVDDKVDVSFDAEMTGAPTAVP